MRPDASRGQPTTIEHERAPAATDHSAHVPGTIDQGATGQGTTGSAWARPLVAVLLPLVLAGPVAADALYRWEDDEGVVSYTDVIPPEQVKRGHVVISPDGVRLATIPRVLTEEEARMERELQLLRAEQERLQQQQRVTDLALLRTFRGVDEMLSMLRSKLDAVDSLLAVTRRNIRHQQVWLASLAPQLVDPALPANGATGKATGDQADLKHQVAAAIASIKESMRVILQRERQKRQVLEVFERDVERFQQLKGLIPKALDELAPEVYAIPSDRLLVCRSQESCERLWSLAQEYARDRGPAPLITHEPDLWMTGPAQDQGQDSIALTLVRIWDAPGERASIVLDLQCAGGTAGGGVCSAAQRQAVWDDLAVAVRADGRLYRWVGEHGRVYYIDVIPPGPLPDQRITLPLDGLSPPTEERNLTPREALRERELKELRTQQERLLAQQVVTDEALLRTFPTLDDMIAARDRKLAELDEMIQVTQRNIRYQQTWLGSLNQDLAQPDGRSAQASYLIARQIAAAKRSIEESSRVILQQEQEKQAVLDAFALDKQRYLELKRPPSTPIPKASARGPAGD